MSSGIGSLPRARYTRAKRAAILAASASVLTGTSIALPAATFANEVTDPAPIINLEVADTSLDVPDPGVPLPDVEVGTDELLIAPVSGALNLSADVDTSPDQVATAPAAPAPSATEPAAPAPAAPAPAPAPATAPSAAPAPAPATAPAPAPAPAPAAEPAAAAPTVTAPTTEPAATAPAAPAPAFTAPAATAPTAAERAPAEPADATMAAPTQPAWTNIWPALTLPDADVATRYDELRPTSNRAEPTSAAAERPAAENTLDGAAPVVSQSIERVVQDERAERRIDRAVAAEAAEVVETDEAAPAGAQGGLGMTAPLSDLGPRGVETVDLAARNAPNSSMGDWNLMPEVLFAAVPLFLAGAAVAAHGRRNARVAAAHVGVVQRGRHASP